jgi:DNA-directed RNA polymerase II subunit RPB2
MSTRLGIAAVDMEWTVIRKFFQDNENYIAKHHIDAYNDFVRNKLPRAIKAIPIKVVRIDEKTRAVRHEIDIKIGGEQGEEIFLTKPVYRDGDAVHPLYPNEACVKNLYYCSDLFAHVTVKYTDFASKVTKTARFEDVRIGTVPIMVRSCLCVLDGMGPEMTREMGGCPYDQGGYFIVDGKEKVIISQERIVTNRVFMTRPDPTDGTQTHSLIAQIQCTVEDDPFKKTVMLYVNNAAHKRRHAVMVKITDVECGPMPVTMAFRALGVESDRRIVEYVVGDADDPANAPLVDFLYHTLANNPHQIFTQDAALAYMKEFTRFKSVEHVRHILVNDFMRNAGPDMRRKAVFLGLVVNRIVRTELGVLPLNNRDNYAHKRADTGGVLVYNLFRDFYNQMRKDIRRKVEQAYALGAWSDKSDLTGLIKPSELGTIFDANIVERGLKAALKGRWPGVETSPEKAGIVQDLNRISYVAYLSHVRRLNTPMSRDIKLAAPRRLDCTQWGVACPLQSPDGGSIGLDKHLAVLAQITIDAGAGATMLCLRDLGCTMMDDASMTQVHRWTKVFVNNDLVACTREADRLAKTLRLYRRNGLINVFTSVVFDRYADEVYVFTHSGRLCRPLWIARDGKLPKVPADMDKVAWHQLFNGLNEMREPYDEGYVSLEKMGATLADLERSQAPLEYVDVEEANNCLVAMWPKDMAGDRPTRHTHCEIHPSTALSLYTNTIPFGSHNFAPRNIFSGAQGKQAVGVYATNFNIRMDTMSYVLHYPQRPLVTTRYNEFCNTDSLPNGENLIVAVTSHTGFNQEDAIIVNQSSVERGMFNLTYLKSFLEAEQNDPMRGRSVIFCNPHDLDEKNVEVKLKRANVLTVDDNGMPRQNAYIEEDDLLLGKLSMVSENNQGRRSLALRDVSKRADKTIEGIIDRTIVFKDDKGELNAKVRMRQFRVPLLGDKMASRHGQKGVCGMLLHQEDMPYTKDGVVPDIIVNAHGFPSRMCVGHIIECLVAKAAGLGGFVAGGTIFEEQDLNRYADVLQAKGFERNGNEIMYNGFTGEQIESEIFLTPTMYFRLKHQAADKINYRSTGPVSNMTRQPVRGRAIDGGLRIGEMERDAILSNGMAAFLKETYIERSDGFAFDYNDFMKRRGEGERMLKVPYSMKLLLQEVASIGVDMRVLDEDEDVEEWRGGDDDDEGDGREVLARLGVLDGAA